LIDVKSTNKVDLYDLVSPRKYKEKKLGFKQKADVCVGTDYQDEPPVIEDWYYCNLNR
jgi:hypothetical protein